MKSTFAGESMGATCLGGLWIFRLAYILYAYENPNDKTSRYIEESYNMKKRAMMAPLLQIENDLFNSKSPETSLADPVDKCARQLSSKIVSGSGPQVCGMFSFFFQGFLQGIFNLGIGS